MWRPLVLLVASLCSAPPDTWGPFRDRREVSATGQRYLVVRQVRTDALSFELCRRRAGAAPLPAAPAQRRREAVAAEIARDPADAVLAAGELPQLPLSVLVADTLDGFLLFDHYAQVGSGSVVRWVDGAGQVTADVSLATLCGGIPKQARHTVSSVWWSRHVSLDETRRSIVVVDVDEVVHEVAMADGAVTAPEPRQILLWCALGDVERRGVMLDLVAGWPQERAALAEPMLRGVFARPAEPLGLRLRAAVALRRLGREVDADALFAAAVADRKQGDAHAYAIRNLTVVQGVRAVAALQRVLVEDPTRHAEVEDAFVGLGLPAAPALSDLARDAARPGWVHGLAARALARIGAAATLPEAAVATLWLLAGAGDADTANAGLNALIALAPLDLAPRLIALLDRGCGDDARIVLYLRDHPCAAAEAALTKAAARFPPDSSEARWAAEALAACRADKAQGSASRPAR